MNINIENLKKKIIYRSNYRGTKEMDKLLGSFVKEIINNLNKNDLVELLDFLQLDDENLYKFNQGLNVKILIKENKITKLFKNYKLK
jgi:antitoxin CptB